MLQGARQRPQRLLRVGLRADGKEQEAGDFGRRAEGQERGSRPPVAENLMTKIVLSASRHIPLNKLVLSQAGTVNLIGSGRDKAGEAGHTNAYAQAATPVTSAQVWKAWVRAARYARKDAAFHPATETLEDAVPVAEIARQVAPGHARSHTPQHRLKEQPIVFGRRPRIGGLTGQQRRDLLPDRIAHHEPRPLKHRPNPAKAALEA